MPRRQSRIDIVFEDAAIIVLNKAAGLVVHPGSGNRDGTLLNALLHHASRTGGAAARRHRPPAGQGHERADGRRQNAEAHTELVRQLAARTVTREYLAVARGDVARATIIDAPIGRHPTQRTTMAVVERGKSARTHVDVVERFGVATLLRCTLETGRTHQIRVHLAAIGHPLVGDPAYGGRHAAGAVPAFHRQALHATRLGLVHPTTREAMSWDAPPPLDFATLIESLRTTHIAAAR